MRKSFGAGALSYPQPVLMLATYNEDGSVDVMNAAWGGITGSTEISISVGVRHKTTDNFKRTGALTISMGDLAHLAACDYLGIVSGKDVPDKFTRAGFTASKSELVDAPIINELAICLECRVKSYNEETHLLQAEIVNVSADESVLDANGNVDPQKAQIITFDSFNHTYLKLGEKVGNAFKDGSALK